MCGDVGGTVAGLGGVCNINSYSVVADCNSFVGDTSFLAFGIIKKYIFFSQKIQVKKTSCQGWSKIIEVLIT